MLIEKLKSYLLLISCLIVSVFAFSQNTDLELAHNAHRNGNVDEAFILYTKIVNTPNSKDKQKAYFGIAYYYHNLKNYQAAEVNIKKALKVKKTNEDYNKLKGESYWLYALVKSKDVYNSKSLKQLKKATRYIETSPLYASIGYNKIFIEKYEEAIIDLNYAIKLDSENSYAYNNRGLAYIRLNKFDLARKDVKKSKELNDSNPFVYLHSAFIYIALNEIDSACLELDKAQQRKTSDGIMDVGLEKIEELKKKHCQDE